MKNQIIIAVAFIFLIGVVSAVYPGETISWNNQLLNEDLSYYITDNSSSVPDLIISITKKTIFVTIPMNTPPMSFSIVFVGEKKYEKKKNFWFFPRRKKIFMYKRRINIYNNWWFFKMR